MYFEVLSIAEAMSRNGTTILKRIHLYENNYLCKTVFPSKINFFQTMIV